MVTILGISLSILTRMVSCYILVIYRWLMVTGNVPHICPSRRPLASGRWRFLTPMVTWQTASRFTRNNRYTEFKGDFDIWAGKALYNELNTEPLVTEIKK